MCLAAPGGASGDTGVIGGEGVPTEEGVSGGLKAHSSHPPISGAPEVQVIYIKRAFVMNLGQCMQELCGLFNLLAQILIYFTLISFLLGVTYILFPPACYKL